MSGRCRRRHAAGLQAGRSLRDNDQKEYLNYAQHGYAGRRKSCGEASSQREGALSGWRWVVRSIRRVQLEGSLRPRAGAQIGRAACRERVCKYVEIWVGAVSLKKKKTKNKE